MRTARDQRALLDRILDTPHLAHVVPRLPPDMLHRVIQRCGLEDCGELVTLATPGQLAAVFDLDLWRAAQPGMDEQFDADRFGVWLQVLVEVGADLAAKKLAEIDVDVTVAALAQHARVFDVASVSPLQTEDGEEISTIAILDDALSCEIGGYRIVSRRTESWDAIVALLLELEAERPSCFHQVMQGCRALSNSRPEVDGLDDLLTADEQDMFDLAAVREQRREQQGYAAPADARAFLQMARQVQRGPGTSPPGNSIARAYFRAIEWAPATDEDAGARRLAASSDAPAAEDSAAAIAALVDVLVEAGVVSQPPPALLSGRAEDSAPCARIQAHLQFTYDRDAAAYSMRSQELAYLANTLAAGCSIQARPPSVQEASDAVAAVCNLGLENWPAHWLVANAGKGRASLDSGMALPEDFLVGHDLVSVFQVGWTVLHEDVCMYAARELIRVLTELRCDDSGIQASLDALRTEMTKAWRKGEPWRAGDALDAIVVLDTPAWAALLGLIGQCPVIHAGLGASQRTRTRAVSATDFAFISENSQIVAVRDFMRSLPEILRR